MEFKDAFTVGIVFGLILGFAAYAVHAFYRLRNSLGLTAEQRRHFRVGGIATAVIATCGIGFVVFAISRPPDISELQEGLFQGCQQRCVGDGAEALTCDRYCACYVRELTSAHGPRGLNSLVVAASRERDASAIATLAQQAGKCAAQM